MKQLDVSAFEVSAFGGGSVFSDGCFDSDVVDPSLSLDAWFRSCGPSVPI